MNRSFLILIAIGLFATPAFSEDPPASSTQTSSTETTSAIQARPNILWITVEDMSPRLGCYGDTTVPTPNLDRLSSEGLRFTHAFGVYGVCGPNRHCLITGMYPTSTGAMAMRTWKRTASLHMIKDPELLAIPTYEATPPPEVKCFTEYLRAAGYYCTNNAKTDYQFRPPITAWDESSRQAHWRGRPNKETPFFSVFNIGVTHESGTFHGRSPKIVDPAAVDPANVELPPYYPDTPLVRRDVARHYDNIAVMDAQVGKLLEQLEQDGLADETIVFYFSDHGDGLPRMKRWVYDSGIRVPLIVRFPQRQWSGQATDRLVSFVDFAPTVLSLARVDVPPHMQGQTFLNNSKQGNSKTGVVAAARKRKYIYAARDRMDPAPETIRAVRDHRFKYVRNYRTDLPYIGFIPYRDQAESMQDIMRLASEGRLGPDQWQFTSKTKPKEELYDTAADPHEIHNLAADPKYTDKLAELRGAHEAWTKETGDLGHIPETELIKRLWPPCEVQPTTARPKIMVTTIVGLGDDFDGDFVMMSCATPGASIAYRVVGFERWQLYSGRVRITPQTKLEFQAIRLGWKPSGVTTWPAPTITGTPWARHTIDDSSRGADGVKLADINDDGLTDIATGWEEGGITRVYLHPGPTKSKSPWPAVTVGQTPSVEDAVFIDLDGDGNLDVVSCSEGQTKKIFVHWAPKDRRNLLIGAKWKQAVLADSQQWMFAWPMQVDGKHGVDLIAGSKGDNAQIGWFEAGSDGRDLANYRWHPMSEAGWIMSIWKQDMDGDGDTDVVVSDRFGPLRGCRWLENPGYDTTDARTAQTQPPQSEPWQNHFMGGRDREVLSMTLDDLDNDGLQDAIVATRANELLLLKRLDKSGDHWETQLIPTNFDAGFTRAVEVADINGDGRKDLAITTAGANGKHGVYWLNHNPSDNSWTPHAISGPAQGIKYDRIEMLDIDADGDLDLLTCEEHEAGRGLGVFWYENPFGK